MRWTDLSLPNGSAARARSGHVVVTDTSAATHIVTVPCLNLRKVQLRSKLPCATGDACYVRPLEARNSMTFIDWSDREEMLGLLIEYVADERSESVGDPERTKFLEDLSQELGDVATTAASTPADQTIQMLRVISDSQPGEFAGDAVLTHLEACIEELERIRSQGVT